MGIKVIHKDIRRVVKIRRSAFIPRIIHALAIDGQNGLRVDEIIITVFIKGNPEVTRMRNEFINRNGDGGTGFESEDIRAAFTIQTATGAFLDFLPSVAGFQRPGLIHIEVSESAAANTESQW
jgi:hypothetical protein